LVWKPSVSAEKAVAETVATAYPAGPAAVTVSGAASGAAKVVE
jgi:hypothetical protein